jgi:hypothetical protein
MRQVRVCGSRKKECGPNEAARAHPPTDAYNLQLADKKTEQTQQRDRAEVTAHLDVPVHDAFAVEVLHGGGEVPDGHPCLLLRVLLLGYDALEQLPARETLQHLQPHTMRLGWWDRPHDRAHRVQGRWEGGCCRDSYCRL